MIGRRARPLLGTLVEIRAQARNAAEFDRAAERAFAAIAEVHRLMSFHEPASDLRRIARAGAGERVRVHARTAAVLRQALRWHRASAGAFDPACGPAAVAAGWLPAPGTTPRPAPRALDDLLTLSGRDVQVRAPLWLDFGGIAKGYAVDRAVAALRRAGIEAGGVHAGGDLRVFGAPEEAIHVRSPFDPAVLVPVAALREGACATSASGQVLGDESPASHAARCRSVTVFAPTACAADALTKVVWLRGKAAASLLRRARAHAFVMQADGSVWRI